MAKAKPDRQLRPPPPQQAILSRLSFLHQASSLLSTSSPTPSIGLSRYYNSHLLSVSKKSVQRLSPTVKHTICKRCSSILVPGISSTTNIENKSRKGRKKCADVVVVECRFCGGQKRFPALDQEKAKAKKELNKKGIVESNDGVAKEGITAAVDDNDAAMTGT